MVSVKALHGGTVAGSDGKAGELVDVYFDDQDWALRFIVVDTGNGMRHHEVLIPPSAMAPAELERGEVAVNLTREEIEHCPDADTHPPLHRQYDWHAGYPHFLSQPDWHENAPAAPMDRHLRSTRIILGYDVVALDGPVGHVQDFGVQPDGWTIEQIVARARGWHRAPRFHIHPRAVERIDWPAHTMHLRVRHDVLGTRCD
jgi:hypothetical protein